jgi:hypothetical protein
MQSDIVKALSLTIGKSLLRYSLNHLFGMRKGNANYAVVDDVFTTVMGAVASAKASSAK